MPRDREQEQLKAIEEQIESNQVVQDGLSGDVRVAVEAGAITVTKPGTSYTVTYFRPAGSRQLLARHLPVKNDPRVAMSVSEFLVRAWKLATEKARELGWIV